MYIIYMVPVYSGSRGWAGVGAGGRAIGGKAVRVTLLCGGEDGEVFFCGCDAMTTTTTTGRRWDALGACRRDASGPGPRFTWMARARQSFSRRRRHTFNPLCRPPALRPRELPRRRAPPPPPPRRRLTPQRENRPGSELNLRGPAYRGRYDYYYYFFLLVLPSPCRVVVNICIIIFIVFIVRDTHAHVRIAHTRLAMCYARNTRTTCVIWKRGRAWALSYILNVFLNAPASTYRRR